MVEAVGDAAAGGTSDELDDIEREHVCLCCRLLLVFNLCNAAMVALFERLMYTAVILSLFKLVNCIKLFSRTLWSLSFFVHSCHNGSNASSLNSPMVDKKSLLVGVGAACC